MSIENNDQLEDYLGKLPKKTSDLTTEKLVEAIKQISSFKTSQELKLIYDFLPVQKLKSQYKVSSAEDFIEIVSKQSTQTFQKNINEFFIKQLKTQEDQNGDKFKEISLQLMKIRAQCEGIQDIRRDLNAIRQQSDSKANALDLQLLKEQVIHEVP